MEFRTYFKQMETSPAVATYAAKRLAHPIEKFHTEVTEAHLTFAVDAGFYRVSCRLVIAGEGEVTAETNNQVSMYAAVDELTDKVETQLRRTKEKLRSHRARATIDEIPLQRPELDPAESIDAAEIIAINAPRYYSSSH